jgi:predicted oxidoreductase
VDPDALEQTVARHNAFCKTGVDLDFGKGSDPYNRQFGDPRVAKPNPNLAPIAHGPFFALRIYPASLGTTVGLQTSPDAQVLAAAGSSIPGLYACGNDMGNVFRGYYPGGGATLGPGLAFAYRAIEHIAAQAAIPRMRRDHGSMSTQS